MRRLLIALALASALTARAGPSAALDTDSLGRVLLMPLPGQSCLCAGQDLLALLDVPSHAAGIAASIESAQAQMAMLDPSIGFTASAPMPRTTPKYASTRPETC
jgi:hypothetical protein